MTVADDEASDRRLHTAVVLESSEDTCIVFTRGRRAEVPYARPFPRPRSERVSPGNLVAVATASDGDAVVVWRWFDAVILTDDGKSVTLWETSHGSVAATPRNARRTYRPGTRAYLSSGLPGAEWWVAGPVVDAAEEADVELSEVHQFFTGRGLWSSLT